MNINSFKKYYGLRIEHSDAESNERLAEYFRLLSFVQKPLISLVIPVYKAGDTLLAHLLSLSRQQTLLPYEVIFVNNNADNTTLEILTCLGANIINEKKQGISHARQKGLDLARGKIVCTMDPDTLYEPSYIDKMCLPFFFDKKLVCCFSTAKCYQDTFRISPWLAIRNRIKIAASRLYPLSRGMSRVLRLRAHALSVRKDVLQSIGYPADMPMASGCDDGLIGLQLYSHGRFKHIQTSIFTCLPRDKKPYEPFPFCNQILLKKTPKENPVAG